MTIALLLQTGAKGWSDAERGLLVGEGVDVEDGDEDGDERILMLSGSGLEVGTKESGEGWKRRSFARRPEVGSRAVVQ